ncbi:MAG: relaxase/mobilization nuclease domain-containing protein [Flavobacteriaceae bacterium]
MRRKEAQSLGEITRKIPQGNETTEHQAIGFVHRDQQHTHVHLYVNRIDFNGRAYNDSFIGKKSQQAARKCCQGNGAYHGKEVQQEKLDRDQTYTI